MLSMLCRMLPRRSITLASSLTSSPIASTLSARRRARPPRCAVEHRKSARMKAEVEHFFCARRLADATGYGGVVTETYLTLPIDRRIRPSTRRRGPEAVARRHRRRRRVRRVDPRRLPRLPRRRIRSRGAGGGARLPARQPHTAVYDDAIPAAAAPVGTVNSWSAPLTVPGGARRRQLGDQLGHRRADAPSARHRPRASRRASCAPRTRSACPLAILTVSESVIYGRWGFGPATLASEWRVDTKRVRWAGAETTGRLSFTRAGGVPGDRPSRARQGRWRTAPARSASTRVPRRPARSGRSRATRMPTSTASCATTPPPASRKGSSATS